MSDADSTPPEGFRIIPGYPRYAINEIGIILSVCLKGRASVKSRPWSKATRIASSTDKDGYQKVQLTHDGHPKGLPVHGLVLLAFVGPCPDGLQCRHLDGNPANNHVSNLAWGTRIENAQDTVLHGTAIRGEKSPNAKLKPDDVLEIRRRRANGDTLADIAYDYDISSTIVSLIVRRLAWKNV